VIGMTVYRLYRIGMIRFFCFVDRKNSARNPTALAVGKGV